MTPSLYIMSWGRSTFGLCLESTFDHIALRTLKVPAGFSLVSHHWMVISATLWNLTCHADASHPGIEVTNVKEFTFEPRKR